MRGANVGADRDIHADEAGRARQDRADQETDRDQSAQQVGEQPKDDNADQTDGHVLALQIGLRALAHGGCDFLHARIAGIRFQNRHGRPDGVNDGKCSAEHNRP